MRILTSLLFFFAFTILHGQDRSASVFTLKPTLGINACQVHGDSYSGYNKPGAFAGISVNGYTGRKTSIELGFYFSQKGARKNQNPKTGDYSFYRLNLNYIDLPLSLMIKLNSHYFFSFGASFAYLFSYNENINNVDMSEYSNFKKTETGLNFGLGRKLKDGFSVEVRSSNSVTAIREYGIAANLVAYTNPIARFFNKGFYNNLLTVMVAYNLGHNKQSADKQP